MLDVQRDVTEFHRRFGHPAPTTPTPPPPRLPTFRGRIIREELVEVIEHLLHPDLCTDLSRDPDAARNRMAHLAGELCDLIYVVVGTAVALGIDLEPHWRAVHAANMTKIPNGQQKPTKLDDWTAPDHIALLAQQFATAEGGAAND